MFCHALANHKTGSFPPSDGGPDPGHQDRQKIGGTEMRRIELHEIHDHPGFPAMLRDLVTDGMQALWNFGNTYKPILGDLLRGMKQAGSREVLDLCSGGGGPWIRLAREPAL
jgi:hypothetical protein